ncbi:hypothetical protein MSAN_00978000 [Mycena sanguinolenta]|uniref:Uncharacterized protein n=1 Tax=Mycena sanguinolenta TaxID=230812 RepID=A0A8H7DD39_9AGAR|nr:hypothetical protein MSAN_00978000 [Mycena sanguinolenta]
MLFISSRIAAPEYPGHSAGSECSMLRFLQLNFFRLLDSHSFLNTTHNPLSDTMDHNSLPPMDPSMLVAAFASLVQQHFTTPQASLAGPGIPPSQVPPATLPSLAALSPSEAPASAPAPRASAYVSSRHALAGIPASARGHPSPATATSQYQPFLGTSTLAVPMAGNSNQPRLSGQSRARSNDRPSRSEVSEANYTRNLAINTHFPSTASLPPRQRRRARGRAAGTPTLPTADTSPASVLDIDPSSGQQLMKLDIHVYLHTSNISHLHVPVNLADSFEMYLRDRDLFFSYSLPADTKVIDVATKVAGDMTASPTKWSFAELSPALRQHLRRHETLHLQILGLVNRGVPRPRDGCIGLRPHATDSSLTLFDLLNKRNTTIFSKPDTCIRKSRLILRFSVASAGITGLANIQPFYHISLRQDRPRRRHSCLPSMMHSLFSVKNEAKTDMRSWTPPDCFSDGETDEEMEVEDSLFGDDAENLPPTPTPHPQATAPAQAGPSGQFNDQTDKATAAPLSSLSLQAGPTEQASSSSSLQQASSAVSGDTQTYVSSPLWASAWVPIAGQYRDVYRASDYPQAIFTKACGTVPTNLVVSGRDVTGLAHNLIAAIKAAAAIGDFTQILSPRRTFNIDREDENFLSTGEGVEREVIFTAFSEFTSHAGTWFLPRFDSRCSIATTMSLAASSLVNTHRRDSLVVLGCLTALMLIHGLAPEPISPALLQYAANKCDIRSLTREFVGEWHPDLRAMLDSWINMGPTGDLTRFQQHFSIYHDIQAMLKVSSLQSRDLRQHEAVAVDMLHTALIGPHPPTHTELRAFFFGFRMPTRSGFDFTEVLRSAPEGSASLLSRLWISIIHDFSSLQSHMSTVFLSRPTLERLVGQDTTNPILGMSQFDLLCEFLQGTGVPCPELFDEAKPRFSPLIPLDEIDSPAFRSRALCWATTGSPHVEFDDSKQLMVHFVDDQDTVYHSNPTVRAALMKMGTVSFRSCFREARIPVLHLIDLCSQSYPARDVAGNPTEPHTLKQAIESWLLIEILGNIGNHTIL